MVPLVQNLSTAASYIRPKGSLSQRPCILCTLVFSNSVLSGPLLSTMFSAQYILMSPHEKQKQENKRKKQSGDGGTNGFPTLTLKPFVRLDFAHGAVT